MAFDVKIEPAMNSSFIKEEFDDAEFDAKIEPAMNSSLIKEEFDDAEFDAKIEPVMNLLLNEEDDSSKDLIVEKQKQIIGVNYSMNELVMKEGPLQDDLVSKC